MALIVQAAVIAAVVLKDERAPTAGPIGIETRRPDPSRGLPTMAPPPLRCHSYAIGSSIYTDCR